MLSLDNLRLCHTTKPCTQNNDYHPLVKGGEGNWGMHVWNMSRQENLVFRSYYNRSWSNCICICGMAFNVRTSDLRQATCVHTQSCPAEFIATRRETSLYFLNNDDCVSVLNGRHINWQRLKYIYVPFSIRNRWPTSFIACVSMTFICTVRCSNLVK